ncbi:MAG: hypothetical protein SW833_13635 [Cyanobacteriota bacterium]|nr:hypothetical protein [Cyanobacteriota bacterium]
MERGLLWLPLLAVFFGLAWAGWNEYQKIEAYQRWAEEFEKAKYDIRAVLGQKGDSVTWGKPSRSGPIDLQTFSLQEVESIELWVGDRALELDNPPPRGAAILQFNLTNGESSVKIPFTESPLAAKWGQYLSKFTRRGT